MGTTSHLLAELSRSQLDNWSTKPALEFEAKSYLDECNGFQDCISGQQYCGQSEDYQNGWFAGIEHKLNQAAK